MLEMMPAPGASSSKVGFQCLHPSSESRRPGSAGCFLSKQLSPNPVRILLAAASQGSQPQMPTFLVSLPSGPPFSSFILYRLLFWKGGA